MENRKSKLLVRGVFGFDRAGILHLLTAFCAAATIALVIIHQINKDILGDLAWVYELIGAGLALFFAIIGIIGKAVVNGRRFRVYDDHIEYKAGGKIYELGIDEIFRAEATGNILTIKANKDVVVKALVNAENAADIIEALLHPENLPTLSGPDMIYVNIALEELRKAKELLDCGMITKEDYLLKKKKYVDAVANFYLVRPGEATRRIR
ncbi:MAG: hypothetical protein J6A47_06735 [Bacilli bacterium]|nr:hypothetical protein [Bacilli bacterium]